MAERRDGLATKSHLLAAARRVFAEKGYRDATSGEICSAARANAASINYHFGSKEKLYAEVWKEAFQEAIDRYPLDGGLGADASAEARLKATVQSLLRRMLDSSSLGYAGQIVLMELANPTEALELVKQDVIEPLRRRMHAIVRELVGPKAAEEQVVFCAISIIHQCLGFGFKKGKLPAMLESLDKETLLVSLTEHIYRFSVGGIRAVRPQVNAAPHVRSGECVFRAEVG
ncbi:MAG: CerR family C-terminal domain-containing protein [Phycisphaerae bacterium]|nr:CerR family C-terminal domain-containing protein [Phycisphaerae bacterium]